MDNTALTLAYYNTLAVNFTERTQGVYFSVAQEEFSKYVPQGGTILDLGCGSGKDSKVFIDAGYKVTAMDGSEKLCKIASKFIGQEVICATFQEYEPKENFDGIWACASLLHLPTDDIVSVMNKLAKHLKEGGCFYASFKYGDFSGIRNGRFFQNMTEEHFNCLLKKMPSYEIISANVVADVRPGKENENWFCVFLRKV